MFDHTPHVCRHTFSASEALRGLKLAFVSDLHVCPFFPPKKVKPVMDQIASLQADCILWGGDYAESIAYQRQFFALASSLRPPLGMYAVLGNNDRECYGSAFPLMRSMAAKAGARLLINEEYRVPFRKGGLVIGGLDEWKYGYPCAKNFFKRAQKGDLRILLTHYPHTAETALKQAAKPPQLVLSGHTHGGQIAMGRLSCYNLGYGRRYSHSPCFRLTGWHELAPFSMLVSNGVGESLLPVRIGAQRQIHLITLI